MKWFFKKTENKVINKVINYDNLVVIEDGIERKPRSDEVFNIRINNQGKNNVVKLELPYNPKLSLYINFISDNNTVVFHRYCMGQWNVSCFDGNCSIEIGEKTMCISTYISAVGGSLQIGKECLFANDIIIWAGDGHSVLDLETKSVLNKPKGTLKIGNHCWIGQNVSITKSAEISEDCIVGIGSVVTKKFTEKHVVIAGNPARVVKTGITWNGASPLTYDKQTLKKS
ncbi:MAG: acyltransferase [Alphaproteobacteria bacterium]|nr:acyltransferase [Alphaproteobacteria bacterium]